MVGGALMAAVGLAYLAFESFVLSDFSSTQVKREGPYIGRVLVGIQVSQTTFRLVQSPSWICVANMLIRRLV